MPAAPDALIVTALPPTVVRAAVYMTSSLIKQRGGSAMVLRDISSPEMTSDTPKAGPQGSAADRALAEGMLRQFIIATGGS